SGARAVSRVRRYAQPPAAGGARPRLRSAGPGSFDRRAGPGAAGRRGPDGRLPTARELDAASADHPIFVQRGGHVAVANSAALRMAGITATSADPPSGTVVRLADGTPAGALIEAGALDPVRRLLPPVTQAQQAGLLARQCQLYNRSGIGVVRDPGLVPDEVPVYHWAATWCGIGVRNAPAR